MKREDEEHVLGWPGMRSEYSRLAPHDGEAITKPGQVGVVFTGHRHVAYRHPGTSVVSKSHRTTTSHTSGRPSSSRTEFDRPKSGPNIARLGLSL